jgi:hypothetical protein
MRDFLTDIQICGAVCVWSEGEVCRYAINNLLDFCDRIFISKDHSDDITRRIIDEYVALFPSRVIARDSTVRPVNIGERIMSRHKRMQGEIREEALKIAKEEHKKKPIDILVFPDSDEVWCDGIGKLLEEFWNSKADTVFCKSIEVYDSPYLTINQGLLSHGRIYKFEDTITAIPYHSKTYLDPYSKRRNIMKAPWTFVHLARLDKENRELRCKLRLTQSSPELKLRRISKPAWQLTPREGWILHKSDKFLRLGDYKGNILDVPLIL